MVFFLFCLFCRRLVLNYSAALFNKKPWSPVSWWDCGKRTSKHTSESVSYSYLSFILVLSLKSISVSYVLEIHPLEECVGWISQGLTHVNEKALIKWELKSASAPYFLTYRVLLDLKFEAISTEALLCQCLDFWKCCPEVLRVWVVFWRSRVVGLRHVGHKVVIQLAARSETERDEREMSDGRLAQ